ncbi:C40 family peptidase [Xanthocytophaga agilis]|uniref:C40 family peptidase n=1 Tax=Xanthocytophaga agilis TaxID=3048010 RepID=A0AAE3R8A4_9BACT|nr:C40 family peptidase [Xanthocytophaga agilis]MDJ1503245.1 C40 family peptidase [Xanthocytophaga agilis]
MTKLLLISGLLFLSCLVCSSTTAAAIFTNSSYAYLGPADSTKQDDESPLVLDSLISYAKNYLGVPYRSGGHSAKGFDCSGFTSHVFSRFGFSLPRTSYGQATVGKKVETAEMQKGDLIFFKGRNRKSKVIGHVGIVISAKGEKIQFIHASVNNGISIETIDSKYYNPRFVKSIRLIDSELPIPAIEIAESCTPAADCVSLIDPCDSVGEDTSDK